MDTLLSSRQAPQRLLELRLMHERSLGQGSQWHPYIATLPSVAMFLPAWPHHELRGLLRSEALTPEAWRSMGLENMTDTAVTFFSAVFEELFEQFPAVL